MNVARVQKEKQIPIWCKITLSIEETAKYSGKSRDISVVLVLNKMVCTSFVPK